MNIPQAPMMNPFQQAVMNGINSYFNRGTHGPTEYGHVPHGGHGGMQNSWTPPHVAPQHYPQTYAPPYAGIGFNPNQNVGQHQYGMPKHEEQEGSHREEVKRYMRDICEGREQMPQELVQMMCLAASEAVKECMGNERNGSAIPYSAGGYSDGSHEEFKKTIEKIRKTSHMQEKLRMISECFPQVQQGSAEHKVLVDLVTKVPSVAQRAGALNMQPEQYYEIKNKLKHMLK